MSVLINVSRRIPSAFKYLILHDGRVDCDP